MTEPEGFMERTLALARAEVDNPRPDGDALQHVLEGLLRLYDEQRRLVVGLTAENAGLRAKARQPEQVDLSGITTTDLLAEVTRRIG